MSTIDLNSLTEVDYLRLQQKWKALSPNHHASLVDDGRNFFSVIERDALKFTAERLRFVVVRRKTQMTLNVEVGQSTEQHAETWLPLSDLPTRSRHILYAMLRSDKANRLPSGYGFTCKE